MDKDILLKALKSEIVMSMGCTDPGAVCFAAHRAARALGMRPLKVIVTVSPNIYKNGISVGVPGTGMRGLHIAAAVGAVLDPTDAGLDILNNITPETLEAAVRMVSCQTVEIRHAETDQPLYIKAEAISGNDKAHVIITGDYTNIVEISANGRIVSYDNEKATGKASVALKDHSLKSLFNIIGSLTEDDLSFLYRAVEINLKAANAGLDTPCNRLGAALSDFASGSHNMTAAALRAQLLTAAASEARMSGMQVPIMAIAGSGNHGITNFLGIYAVAETINAPREKLLKALAISSTVTVVIKEHIKRLSAFCGCSVAAAAGVAAGTVYLLDGTYEDSVNAMQSVIGTLAGMVCDGAKESCAYKLSTSTFLAVQSGYIALKGAYIPAGMGIVGDTIEDTFKNLGKLNNPGMLSADRLLLNMIGGNRA